MNKVLITGATGLLGSNAAITLYRLGYDVRVMIRRNADVKVLCALPCEQVVGDINCYKDVLEAMTGCDIVVHAASVTEQWGVPAQTYTDVNITGTKNIADACVRHKVKRLIYVSTANTMAPGSKANPGNELGCFNLFYIGSPYINTKYIAQQIVLEKVATHQLPAVVINPTFMIGANDKKPSSGKLILYALGKKILFYPPGGKNFVHVDDVCNCILKAINTDRIGECFLVAAENHSYRSFFRKINRIEGQSPFMIKIPAFILLAAGLIGSCVGWILNKRLKLNYSTARLLCLNNYYTGKKTEEHFNIKYKPVDTAIKEAIAWFKTYKFS